MNGSLQVPRLPRYLRLSGLHRLAHLRLPWRDGRVPWRGIAFTLLLIAYGLLTLGVIMRSPMLTLDRDVLHLDLKHHWPGLDPWMNAYVVLGQRAPSTLVALPWFLWRAWRQRSPRPLILLGTALLTLNVSVGAVKLATGRLGPLRTHHVHAVFEGGNIFPSGHTANAVVLYGVMAWLAVKYRRTAIAAAVFLATTIGLTTIYLDTHWMTDVLGGWLAGGLVLLALPTLMPYSERLVDAVLRRALAVWRRYRSASAQPPPTPPDDALIEDSDESDLSAPTGVDQGNETPVSSSASDQRPAAVA